jgi:hypothetical protein
LTTPDLARVIPLGESASMTSDECGWIPICLTVITSSIEAVIGLLDGGSYAPGDHRLARPIFIDGRATFEKSFATFRE